MPSTTKAVLWLTQHIHPHTHRHTNTKVSVVKNAKKKKKKVFENILRLLEVYKTLD